MIFFALFDPSDSACFVHFAPYADIPSPRTEQPPSAGFLLSVIVHNQSFSPAEPSVTKKEAKSAVALLALQELGLLPKE